MPFAKTGGLGDVAGTLPKALRGVNPGDVGGATIDSAIIHPLYQETDRRLLREQVFDNLEVNWLGGQRRTRVFFSEAAGVPAFLIDAPEYFARPGIYGFRDDHERFAFFGRAALALLRRLDEPPEVLHGNDWPCGFAAVELLLRRHDDPFFASTRTLFSIHNLAYQGLFEAGELWRLGFSSPEAQDYFMMNGAASALKAGLMASDMLSTVSRRYASEIQTAEHGHGLEWLLRLRHDRLAGITNGVDYEVWNPATDPHLAARYSVDDLAGKRDCKLDLLRRYLLPEELERPVIASISRLTAQKGFDLVREAAGRMLETGAFIVSLGSGAQEYEDFFQALHDHAPHRVGIYRGFNEELAHKIEAGADIFLMPSQYEPCGLNQMYSMRYGTVPVVRATGGLDDTVENFDRVRGTGHGFKFNAYTTQAMLESLHEALSCYAEPEVWRKIQLNGMRADNSWHNAARRYAELYRVVMKM